MAGKVCLKCKEEKTTAHYIAVNSPLHSGSLPICRECLAKMIAAAPENERWNTVDKICQWANVPFVPEEWDKIYFANGKDSLGVYFSIFRNKEYERLNWQEYNDVYLQLAAQDRVADALPQLQEKKYNDLKKKWGAHYTEQELEYLENLHQGLLVSQNVNGALNEDQALKLCKISLVIEDKIRACEDFSKDLKGYENLAQLANLTPKNVKDANEFDSAGEIMAYLEKTGFCCDYYTDSKKDEVDFTINNMKNWVRYLYVNETGIAEEIEERINSLKTAAQLEGEEFNEKEFRDYMEHENELIEEDFKIDI